MILQIIQWLQTQDTLTIIVAIIVIAYFIYQGALQIPFINSRSEKNPHIKCRNYKDMQNRLSRLMVLKTEIDRFVNIQILKEQMLVVEQTAYEIRKKVQNHFVDVLMKVLEKQEGITNSKEYITFESIAKNGEKVMIDYLRYIMKENHIPENEAEFTLYVEDKISSLVAHVSDEFNASWHDGLGVSREYHIKALRGQITGIINLRSEIGFIISKMFRRCKEIYKEQWLEIIRYDNEAAALFPEIYQKVSVEKEKKIKP